MTIIYDTEIWSATDRIFWHFGLFFFFGILDCFLLFYPLTTQKIKILKKLKKRLGILSFYTCVPKTLISISNKPYSSYQSAVVFLSLGNSNCDVASVSTGFQGKCHFIAKHLLSFSHAASESVLSPTDDVPLEDIFDKNDFHGFRYLMSGYNLIQYIYIYIYIYSSLTVLGQVSFI